MPDVERVVAAIAAEGYAIVPDFLHPREIVALRERARTRDAEGALRPAGVGRGARRVERGDVRGDRIAWLDATAATDAEVPLFEALEALRLACNRELTLGLFDFEGHYALYPPGAGYERHRDAFRDDDTRVLSFVLYLNAAWQPGDGGELRLFLDGATVEVRPEGGTLVAFLSGRFDHEVRPARRDRLALTGWFRRRSAA